MLWNMTNISTFQSTCTLSMMVVFCTSLLSGFPGMLSRHSVNDLKMVQVATFITGITFVFTLKIRYIFVLRFMYSEIFSVPLLITFYHLKLQWLLIYVFLLLTRIITFENQQKIKSPKPKIFSSRSATCLNQTLSLSWLQERKDKCIHSCTMIEISMSYVCYFIKCAYSKGRHVWNKNCKNINA